MNIKNVIEKFFINGENRNASTLQAPKDGTITRQQLLDEMYNHFIIRFNDETTTEGMLFPTSFRIFLHPKDYQKQEHSFSITAREVVNKFHRMLKDKQLTSYPSYIPHSTYWLFQYIKFSDGNIVDELDSISKVNLREPVILSTIFDTDFSKSNISNDQNIVATVHNKNSNTMEQLNLNMDAFLGMEMDSKDRFRFDFNKSFDKISETSTNKISGELATLKCDTNFIGTNGTVGNMYKMTSELLLISSLNDKRTSANIVRINSDKLIHSHIQIRYTPIDKQFSLAAFEDNVRLNEKKVVKSSGGNINWISLSNNSSILINGDIQIKFLINN